MDYDHLIPDYLNDALDEATRADFEAVLAADPALQAKVEEERAWGTAMRQTGPENIPHMDFEPVRAKLTKMPAWLGSFTSITPAWGYSMASIALVAVIGYVSVSQAPEPEYRTLTEPEQAVSVDVLRIVVTEYAAIQPLVGQYNLTLIQQYPAALTIDVDASVLGPDTVAALRSDGRVKLIQHIQSGNAQ